MGYGIPTVLVVRVRRFRRYCGSLVQAFIAEDAIARLVDVYLARWQVRRIGLFEARFFWDGLEAYIHARTLVLTTTISECATSAHQNKKDDGKHTEKTTSTKHVTREPFSNHVSDHSAMGV